MHTGFWCGNLKERDYLEDLGVGGRIIIKGILGRVHSKLTKLKQNRSSVSCDKIATILQHLWNIFATLQFGLCKCSCFLQLSRVPSPVGKDQNVSGLFQVSRTGDRCQRSVDGTKTKQQQLNFSSVLTQSCCHVLGHWVQFCAKDMDSSIPIRTCSREETCKLIELYREYSLL
jgi:hypothetical protein